MRAVDRHRRVDPAVVPVVLGQLEPLADVHERQAVRRVAVDLVGRGEDERRLRARPVRVASSRFSVPLALTPKSVCGSEAAQSCDGCAAVWMTAARSPPTRSNRRSTPSASRMSSSSVRNSARTRPAAARRARRRGVGPEEPRAHVVLDADHVVARPREVSDGLRSDQPAGARDDDRGHQLSVNSRAGTDGSGGAPPERSARRIPPRGGNGPQQREPRRRRQHDVNPDEPGRQRASATGGSRRRPGRRSARRPRSSRAASSGSRSRRRTRNQTATAASPRTVPVVECRSIAQLSVSPGPCQVIRSTTSPVPAPPACGPAAVTIVPPVSDANPSGTQRPDRPRAHPVATPAAARRARTSPATRARRTPPAAASTAGSA